MAQVVAQLPNARQQFLSSAGAPLAGGTVGTYIPGTLQAKTTWQDSAGTVANQNPAPLDALGSAAIWGSGYYRQIVKDALGNTIWDAVAQAAASGSVFVNVLDFGADPTGIADSTAAINSALAFAGANGVVWIPAGTFLLSATLNALTNQQIIGAGPNSTIFRRFTDYGNTLNFANAGACSVKGIWFYHGTIYQSGDIALNDRITSSTAHIYLANAQGVNIEGCWMWRMPYQVNIANGSLVTIDKCNMQGTWDNTLIACQEGVASVYVGSAAYTQIVKITRCYIPGSGSTARNITYTSTDTGAHTFSLLQDIGSKYGILVAQCEDLLIDDNYLGGQNVACINATLVAASANLDWRITNNLLDGAGVAGALMQFNVAVNGVYINGLIIANNVLNGEQQTFQGIIFYNPIGVAAVVNNFTLVANTFQAIVGSAIMLYHANGGVIGHNSIPAYNSQNCSAGGDSTFSCAIWGDGMATNILCDANIIGGTVNADMAPSFCYQGIVGATLYEKNTIWNGVGANWNGAGTSGQQVGKVDCKVVVIGTANYTLAGTEDVLLISQTANHQVTPPATPFPPGYTIVLKDGAGNAATFSTQFIGTVDGVTNPVYSTNYFVKKLMYSGLGTVWSDIGN